MLGGGVYRWLDRSDCLRRGTDALADAFANALANAFANAFADARADAFADARADAGSIGMRGRAELLTGFILRCDCERRAGGDVYTVSKGQV